MWIKSSFQHPPNTPPPAPIIFIIRLRPPQQSSDRWDPPNTQASIVMDATRRRARARSLDVYIRAHRIQHAPVGLREGEVEVSVIYLKVRKIGSIVF